MGSFGIGHWLIVLLVVVLVFGTKKLRNMGGDLGSAVKGFKDGVKGEDDAKSLRDDTSQTIDMADSASTRANKNNSAV